MSYHRFSNRITDLLTADRSNIHTTVDQLVSVIKHIVYALSSRRLVARNVHVFLSFDGGGEVVGEGVYLVCACERECLRV